eukprot:3478664-Prymnesium_polylepis.1
MRQIKPCTAHTRRAPGTSLISPVAARRTPHAGGAREETATVWRGDRDGMATCRRPGWPGSEEK